MHPSLHSLSAFLLAAACSAAFAQPANAAMTTPGEAPEAMCGASPSQTIGSFHAPLAEQYIWTADDAAVITHPQELSRLKRDDFKVEPHFFRTSFTLAQPPPKATLYVAGPRIAHVWINGNLVTTLHYNGSHHIGFAAMAIHVAPFLRTGDNTLALEVVRGYGSHHHTNSLQTSWLNSGEVLAVKILPADQGVPASPLLQSDATWKSTTTPSSGWQSPHFNDAAWKPVATLGGIESNIDFFQWNADAGMYAWPGYLGEAPYLANCLLPPATTTATTDGLLLDFGHELNGRLLITARTHAVHATIRYGESLGELLHQPFLGDISLDAPAGHIAHGPKTGFRYALVRYADPKPKANVAAEAIAYPASQVASFESSDPTLNRIWNTAVDTAHLSMQDSILDGIKRDRGRWAGDNEVIDRVIADVYGDARLVRAGLEDSIGNAPVTGPVNGLPGYSAWWVISESEYVMRWGDLPQLGNVHSRMLQLLALMQRDLDAHNIYAAKGGGKPFVDWAPEFSSDSPEARRAVHFEYLLAFRRAAWLLRLVGDNAHSQQYDALADAMTTAAQQFLTNAQGAFGDRWQTNAIAVLAGAVQTPAQRRAVWSVLARTVAERKSYDVITPYYGSYLLAAMAELGHRQQALAWMRAYWGSMLNAGATSFWEAWDPQWAASDPHARLQADDKVGYYTSLSHGWSSSPAAWLLEQIIGVTSRQPGDQRVQVRPDLAGLQWIKGAVATPLGALRVEAAPARIAVTTPSGMTAEVLLPAGRWQCNGRSIGTTAATGDPGVSTIWNQAGQLLCIRQSQ